MSSYYDWKPYVPVAERRAKAARKLAKLKKGGLKIEQVEIEGRKIATTFWGKAWCDHIESFSDYDNRLPRGRTYVRNGSVCHLEINAGEIKAIVAGSELYNVCIAVEPLAMKQWHAVKATCSGKISSLLDLLNGKLSDGVMDVICHRKQGLFPLPGDIKLSCDCPDWATMCKHVAAVLYGVGARLDHEPAKLFLLRGVNHEELVDISSAVIDATKGGEKKHRHLEDSVLSDLFDIEMAGSKLQIDNKQPLKTAKQKAQHSNKAGGNIPQGNMPKEEAVRKTGKKALKEPVLPKCFSGAGMRKKRLTLGLTQAKFAAKIRVSTSTISQWEAKGRKKLNPSVNVMKALKKIWKKV